MKSLVILFILTVFANSFAQDLFFIDGGDTVHLSPERTLRSTEGREWFSDQYGNRVMIDKGIIVELEKGRSPQEVFAKYPIKSFEKIASNIFWVFPNEDGMQFELSRELLKDASVKNSHPNLIRERKLR